MGNEYNMQTNHCNVNFGNLLLFLICAAQPFCTQRFHLNFCEHELEFCECDETDTILSKNTICIGVEKGICRNIFILLYIKMCNVAHL